MTLELLLQYRLIYYTQQLPFHNHENFVTHCYLVVLIQKVHSHHYYFLILYLVIYQML